MKYADLIKNDVVNGNGICVSYWCQGCSIHCDGCHNQQTWDFNGGTEIERDELVKQIISAINANGIKRNFSVLGGEPMAIENVDNTLYIIKAVRKAYPDIKIYLWTGYVIEALSSDMDKEIFNLIDVVIAGPYDKTKRDITLPLRGSSNQIVINLKNSKRMVL